jgi:hypothetical protein
VPRTTIADADRDCGGVVLFPLHRLSGGHGVSHGALDGAGNGVLPRAQALGGGHCAQRAARVWVVSHAVELRHDRAGPLGAARPGGVGRDRAPVAACPGLGVEAGQAPRQG